MEEEIDGHYHHCEVTGTEGVCGTWGHAEVDCPYPDIWPCPDHQVSVPEASDR